MHIIQATNLEKLYPRPDDPHKNFAAVDKINLSINSGEIFGLGAGKSRMKNFLPQSSSDFIYAIIVEEFGLIGGIIIIIFYLLILFRVTVISFKAKTIFSKLLVIGLGLPIIIPLILFSLIISSNSLIRSSNLDLFIVLSGVAIFWFSSHIATPILFEPKSRPINLDVFSCFFLNSSIVIILYIIYLSDSLRQYFYHMSIDLKTVKHISKLARISIDDEKANKLKGDLNNIFEFIEKLNELNTDNVQALTSIAETTLRFRKDEIKSENIREKILKNSPEENKDFFVVPKVVE